jgi:hypothetical protein
LNCCLIRLYPSETSEGCQGEGGARKATDEVFLDYVNDKEIMCELCDCLAVLASMLQGNFSSPLNIEGKNSKKSSSKYYRAIRKPAKTGISSPIQYNERDYLSD